MKIENRKTTTKKGLVSLENLIKSFSLECDIDTIISSTFDCVVDIGGSYNYTWSDKGEIRIVDGSMHIYAWVDNISYDPEEIDIDTIKKIDFSKAFESIKKAIEKYNQISIEKDLEIENFINFCNEYRRV